MLTVEGTGERDVIKAATRGDGASEGSVNLNAVEVPKDYDVTFLALATLLFPVVVDE